MTINQKIDNLRQHMTDTNIHAVIIPSNDPHQSEYVAERWKGREWISGFTGSAGTAVVTVDHAGLWTDSRYYIQGEQELSGTYFTLHRAGSPSDQNYSEWICENLTEGSRVAIDGNLCSVSQYEKLEKQFSKHGITLVTNVDLLSDTWKDQPDIPTAPIFVHDLKYAGESRTSKLARIREKMITMDVTHHLVSTLDDIAWIFNIRGSDVEFNPVAIAYAMIDKAGATLYILDQKIPGDVRSALIQDGISFKDYNDIIADLNKLPESALTLVDPQTTSIVHRKAINSKIKRAKTVARHMKAIKNSTEIQHNTDVMTKDCVAIAKTFHWLEQLHKAGNSCTEAEFADKLAEHRSQQKYYVGESFPAIVGYKGNGAIIHYRPMHGKSAEIKQEGILLVDSGGQYLDGTTDITRTVTLSTPTEEEKRNFTLVLKGCITLTKAHFPEGTTGGQLDILARMHLWQHGLNYGHGTGHGVGFFLNVHELPQGFAPNKGERADTAHEPGMFTSNEPGYYKEGAYGIRTENLMYTVKSKTAGFLEFDTATLYPIDLKLIDETIMTKSEKAWLNKYHHKVYDLVSPHLEGDIKTWFMLKCRGMN